MSVAVNIQLHVQWHSTNREVYKCLWYWGAFGSRKIRKIKLFKELLVRSGSQDTSLADDVCSRFDLTGKLPSSHVFDFSSDQLACQSGFLEVCRSVDGSDSDESWPSSTPCFFCFSVLPSPTVRPATPTEAKETLASKRTHRCSSSQMPRCFVNFLVWFLDVFSWLVSHKN